jgi:hypothetical protein
LKNKTSKIKGKKKYHHINILIGYMLFSSKFVCGASELAVADELSELSK